MSLRGRSSCSRRRAPGVRAAAAAEGASRATEPVEVVGVGSRKDAVIDFCLGSRTLSSTPIRFWTVHVIDNSKVQLIQKGHGTDAVFRDLEPPYFFICAPMVSSVGQDADHITAMELLSAVKSAGNLAASIFLKPFCFEGQRRQVEAADLISKLQTCSKVFRALNFRSGDPNRLLVKNHYDESVSTVQEGFLSNLALHFPFISSLMGGDIPEQKQIRSKHSFNHLPDNRSNSVEQDEFSQLSNWSSDATVSKLFPEEFEDLESVSNDRNERIKPESLEGNLAVTGEMSKDDNREHLVSQQEHRFLSNSPGFDIAQLWAKQHAMASGSSKNDKLDIVAHPVGVKLSKVQSDHSPNTQPETLGADTTVATGHAAFGVPFSDVRLEKVMGVCSSAVTFLRNRMDRSRKRGSNSISSRAALMLVSFSLSPAYLS
ncbi:unnamed protein product [Miscanthus lutarioriparius]|uniref:Uncharacterized protein n=1 Tax=Miscanthus lutarioriparius TaxID=422564 RepID=A0A811N4W0_9POAL|nr:unnamed protein product [Miscanthus lutarioriparius]